MTDKSSSHQSGRVPVLREARYSLRELLQEVQAEREGSSLGQEMVDQGEIAKLFSRNTKVRRAKS